MSTTLRSILLGSLVLVLSGCSLLSPGNKEFFQKKVPSFPDKPQLEEKQKQAADFVAKKVEKAYDEGLKANVTNSVMEPLGEANVVVRPLADSIGHPSTPYEGNSTNLVLALNKLSAKYEASLRRLEQKLDDLEGKKIEGTGLIQVGYFTWLAIVFGIIALLWFVLKIVAIFNPPVALGMSAVSAGTGLLRKGFGEVVEAGETFKDMVKQKIDDPATQAKILELFKQAHMQSQSRDVQLVVQNLTNDPNDPAALYKKLQQL